MWTDLIHIVELLPVLRNRRGGYLMRGRRHKLLRLRLPRSHSLRVILQYQTRRRCISGRHATRQNSLRRGRLHHRHRRRHWSSICHVQRLSQGSRRQPGVDRRQQLRRGQELMLLPCVTSAVVLLLGQ